MQQFDTPFDAQIILCNEKQNKTYIGFGNIGTERKVNQILQDKNARSISPANYAERTISKSSGAYKNASWDLVDRMRENKDILSQISEKELPPELQGKSKEEITTLVGLKTKERSDIQKVISELAKKRQLYINEQFQKNITENEEEDDLGKAITASIFVFAKMKGFDDL